MNLALLHIPNINIYLEVVSGKTILTTINAVFTPGTGDAIRLNIPEAGSFKEKTYEVMRVVHDVNPDKIVHYITLDTR